MPDDHDDLSPDIARHLHDAARALDGAAAPVSVGEVVDRAPVAGPRGRGVRGSWSAGPTTSPPLGRARRRGRGGAPARDGPRLRRRPRQRAAARDGRGCPEGLGRCQRVDGLQRGAKRIWALEGHRRPLPEPRRAHDRGWRGASAVPHRAAVGRRGPGRACPSDTFCSAAVVLFDHERRAVRSRPTPWLERRTELPRAPARRATSSASRRATSALPRATPCRPASCRSPIASRR